MGYFKNAGRADDCCDTCQPAPCDSCGCPPEGSILTIEISGVSPCSCHPDGIIYGQYLDLSPINDIFVTGAFSAPNEEHCAGVQTDGIAGFSFQRYVDNACALPTGSPLDFTIYISIECCTDADGNNPQLSILAAQSGSSEGIVFSGGAPPSNGMIIPNTVSSIVFGCGGTATITWI